MAKMIKMIYLSVFPVYLAVRLKVSDSKT